jgi:hypothetical protein
MTLVRSNIRYDYPQCIRQFARGEGVDGSRFVGSLDPIYCFVGERCRLSELALGHMFSQPRFAYLVPVDPFCSHCQHTALPGSGRQIFCTF